MNLSEVEKIILEKLTIENSFLIVNHCHGLYYQYINNDAKECFIIHPARFYNLLNQGLITEDEEKTEHENRMHIGFGVYEACEKHKQSIIYYKLNEK